MNIEAKKNTYVIAVSGGVDSTALLDMIAKQSFQSSFFNLHSRFIVAHFDHGIRKESGADAEFVKDLAKKFELPFELGRADLGTDASETEARELRYNFLRQCCKKYNALGVITAHHQDDLVETMVINLVRGTSWRGLASLEEESENFGLKIIRPLIKLTKKQIKQYALEKNLSWVEDSTNTDVDYLRNYIRLKMLPAMIKKDSEAVQKLLEIQQTTAKLKDYIINELQQLTSNFLPLDSNVQRPTSNHQIPRYQLIMWPEIVSKEVIYYVLTKLDKNWHPSSLQIERVLHFAKTASENKELQIGGCLRILSSKTMIQFQKA